MLKNLKIEAIITASLCSYLLVSMPSILNGINNVSKVEAQKLKNNMNLANENSSLKEIYQKVRVSVVQITISSRPQSQPSMARLGSGFVFDKQGHIITSDSVIDDANMADVTFVDGNTYTARVIANDPYSDIAVLRIIDNFSEEKASPLTIANSSATYVGQQVATIGNPFGISGLLTEGIISGLGKLIPNNRTGFSIPNAIVTDAPINPGNAGGPLLNSQAQVIGMNTAILSRTGSYSGIGFAIPSNTIAKEVPFLIKNGTYTHPWLGIAGGKITPEIAQSAGLPPNYKGVVIGSVQPRSPADKAGLRETTLDHSGRTHIGDIITAIDGRPVKQIDDIMNYIDEHKKTNDALKLTINRNGTIMNLTATLQPKLQTTPSSLSQMQPPRSVPIPELPQLPPDLAPLLP